MKKTFFALLLSLSFSLVTKAQSTVEAVPASDTIMLNHIAVYVYDLAKSTDFYKNILRFKQIPEPFHDGRHTWFALGSTSQFHLIQGAPQDVSRDKNDHLCFSVPSVRKFVTRLEENNVPYFDWPGKPQSITTRVDGVEQIYFQDPDGHWIEINDDGFKQPAQGN